MTVKPHRPRPRGLGWEGSRPADAAPGIYYLRSTRHGGYSTNGVWLAIDSPAVERAAVPPAEHIWVTPIRSGQTVTGTFTAGGDTTGTFQDYNAYYFIGTAGSIINVSLERVDTSKPWEHPDSLDPQIEVIAPDGFVYQNLVKYDDAPGTNLNASLTGAVLPLSGLYVISAETTRGEGQYRLSFSTGQVVPPAEEDRVVPLSDNFNTVSLNTTIHPVAIMLDPRGYPISGAAVRFEANGTAGSGAVQFVPGPIVGSGPDGSAQVDATATAAGVVGISPTFIASFATTLDDPPPALALAQGEAAQTAAARATTTVPRYQPVALRPFQARGLYDHDLLKLSFGAAKRLPIQRRGRRELGDGSRELGVGRRESGVGSRVTGVGSRGEGRWTRQRGDIES